MNQNEKIVSAPWMFLPSLIVSNFAVSTLGIITALFLVDMSKTFGVSLGLMGQINSVSSIVGIVLALFMSVLSVRFRHRILILAGMVFYALAALGCYFAQDFYSMLLFYSLNGLALAILTPMTNTLIGDHMKPEKRSVAIGWIIAAGSLAYLIGAPLMGVLSSFGGWKYVVLCFVMPLSVLGLLMMWASIPSASQSLATRTVTKETIRGFRSILSSHSAVGCLIGTIFRYAVFAALLFYSTAFTIQRFGLSVDYASIVILLGALFYTIGSLVSSPLIKRLGTKTSTVMAVVLAGSFTMSYAYAPNLWLSVILMSIAGWFDGLAASASTSLSLEQMPSCRGTMMSLSYAFVGVGSSLGAAIGGFMLIFYSYEELGLVLGSMGIIAALIYQLLTVDLEEQERH